MYIVARKNILYLMPKSINYVDMMSKPTIMNNIPFEIDDHTSLYTAAPMCFTMALAEAAAVDVVVCSTNF